MRLVVLSYRLTKIKGVLVSVGVCALTNATLFIATAAGTVGIALSLSSPAQATPGCNVSNGDGTITSSTGTSQVWSAPTVCSVVGSITMVNGDGLTANGSNLSSLTNASNSYIHASLTGSVLSGVTISGLSNLVNVGSITNAAGGSIVGDYETVTSTQTIGTVVSTITTELTGTLNTFQIYGVNNQSIGTLQSFTNNGTIQGTIDSGISPNTVANGVVVGFNNAGSIGTLTNSAVISASLGGGVYGLSNQLTVVGLANAGQIGTLTNSGTIAGDFVGVLNGSITQVFGPSSLLPSSATISQLANSGTISGDAVGILNYGHMDSITNTGLIQDSAEIYGAAIVSGPSASIALIDNQSTGSIVGYGYAAIVNAGTLGALTNEGFIGTGGEGAIAIVNEGAIGTLTNSGSITTNVTAVLNVGGSINSLSNSGYISAGDVGLANDFGTLAGATLGTYGTITTLVNTGTISGGDNGIYNSGLIGSLTNTSYESISSGTIAGGSIGLFNDGSGTINTFDNATGAELTAIGGTALLNNGSIGTVSNDGWILGYVNGVINNGSIGSFSNTQNGIVAATVGGAYGNNGSIGTLSNDGLMVADYGNGVYNTYFGTIGTLINSATGSIVSSGGGPFNGTALYNAGHIGSLTNNGVIVADEWGGVGVVNAGGSIGTLTNGGSIGGGQIGVINTGGEGGPGIITELDNTGTISGGNTGINNSGTIGTLTNTNVGTVTAAIEGFWAGLYNQGDVGSLSNSGVIGGYYAGINNSGGTLASIGTLVNQQGGSITGAYTGIYNDGQIGSLTNNGGISGSDDDGITNDVPGSIGTLANSGTIQGGQTGLYNFGVIGAITNSGQISGGNYGIVNMGGEGAPAHITTLTNSGLVAGYYTGIDNIGGTIGGTIGTLVNTQSGTIGAVGTAIWNSGLISQLTNGGQISGEFETGIANQDSGTIGSLVNLAGGTIMGGVNGIYNDTYAYIGSLSNSGAILGGETGVLNYGSIGTLSNLGNTGLISANYGIDNDGAIDSLINSGTIAGRDTGIDNYGVITSLVNSGAITGATTGIYNRGGLIGSLTNQGLISGQYDGVTNVEGGLIESLSNSGTILATANNGAGVWNDASTIESLTNTGHIVGGSAGVANHGGTIWVLTNSGTIEATGTIGDGVYNSGSIVSLTNSGLIEGTRAGVYVDTPETVSVLGNARPLEINSASMITTLINSSTGTISGAMTGIYNASLIGAVLNSGVISGGGIGVNNQAGIVALVNQGTVTGTHFGVVNDDTIESLTSAGLIKGAVGLANTVGSIGALDNSGTIMGTLSDALYTAGTIGPVSNEGVISGAVNGLNIDATGVIGTLTNSGLISAPTAINVAEGGVFGPISNTGTIAGNILNASVTELAIAGASGSQFGTLTGYTGGISASGIGQITSTAADVAFTGNLLLNDHINVAAGTVTSAALLQVNNPLNITGNYEQSTPATLSVGVTSLANHGELAVSGAATLDPNGHVALTSLGGFRFAAGESFTLIDAPSAAYNVAGISASVTGFNGGYLVSDVQAGGKSDLVVCLTNLVTANCNGAPAYSVATTSNAVTTNNAAGSYMGSDVALNKLANAVGALASTAQANRAGNQLLADPHNNAMGLAMQPTLDVLNVVTGHADSTRFAANGAESGVAAGESGGHIATWGEAFGGGAHQSGDGQFSGYALSSEGLVAGGDVGIADTNVRVGGVFSYTHADLEEHGDRTGDTLALNSYGVLGYGSYLGEHAYVDLLAGVLADTFDTVRFIDFTGFSGVATGSHDGTQYVAKLAGGYRLPMGGASGTTLTPVWGVTYSRLNQNGYTESGGNGAALNVASQGDNSFKGEAGLKLERSYAMQSGDLVPELKFLYRHEFDNGAQLQTASFAADAGATTFSTLDVRPIENSGVLSAGVNLLGKDGITVSLKYSAEVASGYVSQGGALRVRWAF